MITQAQTFDPGHVDLPQAQATLATALESRRRAAARDIARGRLASARVAYEAVLAAVPDDAGARQGLEQVGVAHATLAELVDVPAGKQLVVRYTIEIEGEAKPACVAETVVLLLG